MVFGMMAAISQDLPAIYDFAQYKAQKNSEVVDSTGRMIGTLSSDQNKILLTSGQISPNMKNAVVSIEDARFYEHDGVDLRGIARALVSDFISGSAQQGASTITEQFVKNALEAEGSRTVLEKFREAALAYKLDKHWSKSKILTEYLNTIYFGEGAYGIEAAAQTYFGAAHPGCGTEAEPCAAVLEPWEAAMIAGIIASPFGVRPQDLPRKRARRAATWSSKRWSEQGYITHEQYVEGIHKALPAPADIKPPTLESKAPYFTAFLRQQLVESYGPEKAYFGGLTVHSTLDLAAPGSGRRSRQLLPRRLARDRLGRRHRRPHRRDQGDGRRARLRNGALQPGDAGTTTAGLLDQALHLADGARRGDLAGHRIPRPNSGPSTSASTAAKPSPSTTTKKATSAPARSPAA